MSKRRKERREESQFDDNPTETSTDSIQTWHILDYGE